MMKLKETSKAEIFASVLYMNLRKKPRLLSRYFLRGCRIVVNGRLSNSVLDNT